MRKLVLAMIFAISIAAATSANAYYCRWIPGHMTPYGWIHGHRICGGWAPRYYYGPRCYWIRGYWAYTWWHPGRQVCRW